MRFSFKITHKSANIEPQGLQMSLTVTHSAVKQWRENERKDQPLFELHLYW